MSVVVGYDRFARFIAPEGIETRKCGAARPCAFACSIMLFCLALVVRRQPPPEAARRSPARDCTCALY